MERSFHKPYIIALFSSLLPFRGWYRNIWMEACYSDAFVSLKPFAFQCGVKPQYTLNQHMCLHSYIFFLWL